VLYGVNQRLRVEDVDSPLCEIRPVKSVLLVVLSGDRGLCGGYNNFIIKKVRRGGGGGEGGVGSPSACEHCGE
jgi:F-type H+-transporting ATPase subunit gamma